MELAGLLGRELVEVVVAVAGMQVENREGLVLLRQALKQQGQRHMLVNIRRIAGVEGVLVAQHGWLYTHYNYVIRLQSTVSQGSMDSRFSIDPKYQPAEM